MTRFLVLCAAYVDSRLRNNPKIVVKEVHRVQHKQSEESFALHIRHLAGDDLENLDSIKHERVWHGMSADYCSLTVSSL